MNLLLDALTTAGNVLDTPGSVARGLLAGNPGAALGGIFDPSQRVYGRDLLEGYGLLGENMPGFDLGDVAGFGAEVATDPLNLLGGGLLARALGKTGAARKVLQKTGYFREPAAPPRGPAGWGAVDTVGDDPYTMARAAAAALPPHNPNLRLPLAEAGRQAARQGREAFVYGPARGEPTPFQYYAWTPGQEELLARLPHDQIPDQVRRAWEVMSSRNPRASTLAPRLVENPNFATTGARANFAREMGSGMRPEMADALPAELLGQPAIGVPVGGGQLSPGSLFHETLHAAQNRLGLMNQARYQPAGNYGVRGAMESALEPTAWRRSMDEEQGLALYDYLLARRAQSPLLAALAGQNTVGRMPGTMA